MSNEDVAREILRALDEYGCLGTDADNPDTVALVAALLEDAHAKRRKAAEELLGLHRWRAGGAE